MLSSGTPKQTSGKNLRGVGEGKGERKCQDSYLINQHDLKLVGADNIFFVLSDILLSYLGSGDLELTS